MTTREELGGMPLWEAARDAGVQFAEEVLPEDKFLRVNGMSFHYLDWGNPEKPQMLLLHGGAQTAHSWDFHALAIRDSYHVVALDQRGHGDSDWSEELDYSTETMVKDADAVTDLIGYDSFVLTGLSMGGRNAYAFAARHPEKVRALVIVDVGPDVMKEGSQHIQDFLRDSEVFDSFEWLVERVRKYNPRRPENQIRGSLLNNLRQRDDGKWVWKHDRRLGKSRGNRGSGTAGSWEDIGAIKAPTLIVRGTESYIFAPETARKMLDLIPDSRLVEIEGAGHLVQGDRPIEFEAAVREFLTGL